MNQINGMQVALAAKTWVNTPYHRQAHARGVGADCIGIVIGVALGLGVEEATLFLADPEFRGYGPRPDREKLLKACDRYLDRVPLAAMRLGDIPLLDVEDSPQHFGIITSLNPDYLVHAFAPARKVVENRLDAEQRSRISAVWRFRRVA